MQRTCMHACMYTYIHYGFRGTKPDTEHNASSCESTRVFTHACICVFGSRRRTPRVGGRMSDLWSSAMPKVQLRCLSISYPRTPARMHVHFADPLAPPPPHINTNYTCHHPHTCTHRCSTSRSTTSREATSPFRRRRPKAIVSTNALVAVMAAVSVCSLCTPCVHDLDLLQRHTHNRSPPCA